MDFRTESYWPCKYYQKLQIWSFESLNCIRWLKSNLDNKMKASEHWFLVGFSLDSLVSCQNRNNTTSRNHWILHLCPLLFITNAIPLREKNPKISMEGTNLHHSILELTKPIQAAEDWCDNDKYSSSIPYDHICLTL